jgi:hypothetical protein
MVPGDNASVRPMTDALPLLGDAEVEAKPRRPKKRLGRRCCFLLGFCSAALIAIALAAVALLVVLPGLDPVNPGGCPTGQPPNAPTRLAANATTTAVTLSWRPAESYGSSILRYEVQTNRSGWMMTEPSCLDGAAFCVLDTLAPLLVIAFRVRAVSTAGVGNFTDAEVTGTLSPSLPMSPSPIWSPVTAPDFLLLEWTPPPPCSALDDPSTFSVQVCTAVSSSSPRSGAGVVTNKWRTPCSSATCDGNWTTAPPGGEPPDLAMRHLVGLEPGRAYCLRVRARNSLGHGPWSPPSLLRTDRIGASAPAKPQPPHADPAVDRLNLSWSAPDNRGSAIVRFEATAKRTAAASAATPAVAADGGQSPTPSCMTEGSVTTCSIAVDAGTQYECRVRAVNSKGPGPWSEPTRTHTQSAGVPATPGAPAASQGDPLLLQWAPADPRGSEVIWYELSLDDFWNASAPGGSARDVYNGSVPQSELSMSEDRLLPGYTYRVRARAANARGVGPWGGWGHLSTEHRGGCGNGDDVRIFDRDRGTLKQTIQDALVLCLTAKDKEECVVTRLAASPGLSSACARCWYAEGVCTLSHCALKCVAPESQACLQCSEEHCFPACVECSGLPRWAFPP